jgi:hypothetical protein
MALWIDTIGLAREAADQASSAQAASPVTTELMRVYDRLQFIQDPGAQIPAAGRVLSL